MEPGYLSDYFTGIASKRFSRVETGGAGSNQHEINGTDALKRLFGAIHRKITTRFVYLGKSEEQCLSADGMMTWYDAREGHPTRSEYRLYVPGTAVYMASEEGDLLVIGEMADGRAVFVVAAKDCTYEKQLAWLFNLSDVSERFSCSKIDASFNRKLDLSARFILDVLGIETRQINEVWLEKIRQRFPQGFPSTKLFSDFARETLPRASPLDNPDVTLMNWLEREEMLFRTLEKHGISEQLRYGFVDVDDFIRFSLKIHNRRKSRAGQALENHVEELLKNYGITYSRGRVTENATKPDFIFPNIESYHNATFPKSGLTMLGVKSTCKDRWRQVLSEAARIDTKHLLTLEPSISRNQTDEMRANSLKLVVPAPIHETYDSTQKKWLLDVQKFIFLVKERQQMSRLQ